MLLLGIVESKLKNVLQTKIVSIDTEKQDMENEGNLASKW